MVGGIVRIRGVGGRLGRDYIPDRAEPHEARAGFPRAENRLVGIWAGERGRIDKTVRSGCEALAVPAATSASAKPTIASQRIAAV